MSKPLQNLIFLLFLLGFFIAAPLLVLYTAGYRLDLTNGRIVHTAVLNVSTNPRNATIVIDGKESADRTPAVIDTILPGDHVIELTKTGHLPFETALSFESREAVVLGLIHLFLDAPSVGQRLIEGSHHWVSPDGQQIAHLRTESSWMELWMLDVAQSTAHLQLRLPDIARAQDLNLTWSADGTHILLERTIGAETEVTVVRLSDSLSVTLPDTDSLIDAWWDIGSNSLLYLRTSDSLSRIDVDTSDEVILPFVADHVFTMHARPVSLSQHNNRAVVSYQDGETASIITYLPLGTYTFVPAPEGLIALHETQRNRLILIDDQNREQPILLNEDVQYWDWHENQDLLVFTSGFDLKQYQRSRHETTTLTRLSTPIQTLMWYPEGTTLLYETNEQIIATQLHDGTVLSTTSLAQDASSRFWLSADGMILHVLITDPSGWNWVTRELKS